MSPELGEAMNLLATGIACMTFATTAPQDAKPPASRAPQQRISLDLQNVRLADALKRVCSLARIRCEIDPAVLPLSNHFRVTTHMRDAEVSAALSSLLSSCFQQAPLRFTMDRSAGGPPTRCRIEGWGIDLEAVDEPL